MSQSSLRRAVPDDALFDLLVSPDDGTPLGADLRSESGIEYSVSEGGVLLLSPQTQRPHRRSVYDTEAFRAWNALLAERIRYYTGKRTLAGLAAHLGFKSIRCFDDRGPADWLLDIGCGDGAQLEFLRSRSRYIGLDTNLDRLEQLKRNHPEAVAIHGDAASLPFRDASLSCVFSCHAFEHMWLLKEVALELHRCTTPAARALIVVPTEGGLWSLGRWLISRPHFKRKHPDLDFDLIARIEHCNLAPQVARTLETLFHVRKTYLPLRIPSPWLNASLELDCRKRVLEGL